MDVVQVAGFANQVTLAATGNPAGTTTGFSLNPVMPPGSSTFTVGTAGAPAPGAYSIDVNGTATGSGGHSVPVELEIFDAAPSAATLTAPANNAVNVAQLPVFTWTGGAQSESYTIEVATDSGFTNIVASASGLAAPDLDLERLAELQLGLLLARARRESVRHRRRLRDLPVPDRRPPGDCALGSTANVLYGSEGFESGEGGWTHSGTGDSWAIATTNPHTGTSHFHANNPAVVSDQRLVSPRWSCRSERTRSC